MSTTEIQEKVDRALSTEATVTISKGTTSYVGKLVALDGENYGKVKVVTGKRGRPPVLARDEVTDLVEMTAVQGPPVQDDGTNNVLFERDGAADPYGENVHGNEALIASSEEFHSRAV